MKKQSYERLDMKTWLKAFAHNCIVHSMMMFVPAALGDRLHDWNATWAFGLKRYDELFF